MTRTILCTALVALAIGSLSTVASAAPASGAPIANAAGTLDGVQQVWWDRWGRWHPNRRVIVAPPIIGPACRTVRVCGRWGRCWWTRRCY